MGIKLRSGISIGGPSLNNGAWFDSGDSLGFAAFTNATTAQIFPINIVPQDTSSAISGQDSLGFGGAIGRLMGAQIAFPVIGTSGGVAASSISTLGIAVYRSFGTLGAQIANAGGAITSLSVSAPGVNTYLPSGQTFNLTVAAGGTSQVWTTSAIVYPGALTIPVTSTTPSSTYAKGQPMVGQVGNNICFGWLASASGTPAFSQNASAIMPAMSATNNPNLNQVADPYGPYLPWQPGDLVALYGITSSSTFSVPAGIVNTMGV